MRARSRRYRPGQELVSPAGTRRKATRLGPEGEVTATAARAPTPMLRKRCPMIAERAPNSGALRTRIGICPRECLGTSLRFHTAWPAFSLPRPRRVTGDGNGEDPARGGPDCQATARARRLFRVRLNAGLMLVERDRGRVSKRPTQTTGSGHSHCVCWLRRSRSRPACGKRLSR